jgi:hypothetical protein
MLPSSWVSYTTTVQSLRIRSISNNCPHTPGLGFERQILVSFLAAIAWWWWCGHLMIHQVYMAVKLLESYPWWCYHQVGSNRNRFFYMAYCTIVESQEHQQ